MKIIVTMTAVVIILCIAGSQVTAQDNATIREIPTGSSNSFQPSVKYHPAYKKLLDDLKYLQERQKSATAASAAIGRNRIDAASNRLREYIDSGKPTVLPQPEQQQNRNRSIAGDQAKESMNKTTTDRSNSSSQSDENNSESYGGFIPREGKIVVPSSRAVEVQWELIKEVLLTDDFSSGLSNWDTSLIKPEIQDGKLFFDVAENESIQMLAPIPLENIMIEFDGYSEGNGFNIMLVAGPGKGWSISLGIAENTRSMLFVDDPFSPIDEVIMPAFKPGEWSRYRIAHRKDAFYAYREGLKYPIISVGADTDFKEKGMLSFSSQNTRLGIANVKISILDTETQILVESEPLSDEELERIASTPSPRPPESNRPPVSDFIFTPTNPRVGEEITVQSMSTDPDEDTLRFMWYIKEGKSIVAEVKDKEKWTFHVETPQVLNLTHLVIDPWSFSNETSKQITISP